MIHRTVLSSSVAFLLAAPALAFSDANFDAHAEGALGTQFIEGGITFSELDQALGGGFGTFTAEQADGTLTGYAGFTSPMTLGFGGYSPGSGAAFSRCKSFKMTTGQLETAASLTLFEFSNYAGNTITLQGLLSGNVVVSTTITVPSGFAIHAHPLSVSLASGFDTLQILGGGTQDQGVFFGLVDTVHIGSTSTGTVFCAGDGSATACPCGNASPLGAGEGCLNSLGQGGELRANGTASLANDTIVLSGADMPDSSALYFQGTTQQNGGAGSVFGDGLRCAGGQTLRLGTKTNSGGASQYPTAGDASVSVRGLVTSPGLREYQCWYRNAANFCTSSTFNLTNGVEISWAP